MGTLSSVEKEYLEAYSRYRDAVVGIFPYLIVFKVYKKVKKVLVVAISTPKETSLIQEKEMKMILTIE